MRILILLGLLAIAVPLTVFVADASQGQAPAPAGMAAPTAIRRAPRTVALPGCPRPCPPTSGMTSGGLAGSLRPVCVRYPAGTL